MLYMKMNMIKGSLKKNGTDGWFPIEAMQFGVGRGISSPDGNKRETSMPSVSEVTISKKSDELCPSFLTLCNSPETQTTEIGFFPNDSEQPSWLYSLTETLISGYSITCSMLDTTSIKESHRAEKDTTGARVSLSLNFTKIEVINNSAKAPVKKFSYDIKEGYAADRKAHPEYYKDSQG